MLAVRMLISILIVLAGLYYLIAPHDLHVSSGFGFGLDHYVHQVLGVVLIVIAGALYMMKMKK